MTNRPQIQLPQIEVPEADPFQNDLLGRKRFVEVLADTLKSTSGPAVFAIDGPWGTGKTTFVSMLAQHLRNQDVNVISVNAWETDYAEDPLAALVSSFVSTAGKVASPLKEDFKHAALRVVRTATPAAIRILTGGVLNIDPTAEKELGTLFANVAEDRLLRFEQNTDVLADFRDKLDELAACSSSYPMVVIVDELDRCRPRHAVETLEAIKHVFSTDKVLFVLVVNRSQLDESVRTLYGSPKDAESYFRRFFDVELRLPPGDKESFVRHTLRALNLPGDDLPADMFAEFLSGGPYSIRTLARTMRHYNLVRS